MESWERQTAVLGDGVKLPVTKLCVSAGGIDWELAVMEPRLDRRDEATSNDPKLSDRGVRRGTCMVGGKAAAEAGAVTHGAVRCSAWLAVIG